MVGGSSPEADKIGSSLEEETDNGVFCGTGCLDGQDARVCRDPKGYYRARDNRAFDACQHIVAALARVPACQRVLFETGRMAPMLFHDLSRRGLPVVCVESR
jgi:hypothetical protein